MPERDLTTMQASILSAKVDETIRDLEDALLSVVQGYKVQSGDALLALHEIGDAIKAEIEQRRQK
jgi:hypothetical protein